jgi:predicted ATPase
MVANCLLFRAQFGAALEHLDTALSLTAAREPRREGFGPSTHIRAHAFNFMAWARLFQGYPDDARQRSQASFAAVQEDGHPHLLAFALHVSCLFHQVLGDWRTVRERAAALVPLAREQGFPHFLGTGTFFLSWADMAGGRISVACGIAGMREGLAAKRATGAEIKVPCYLGLIADAERRSGRPEVALELLADAVERVEATGERWFEAELYGYQGSVLAEGAERLLDAEDAFVRACKVAREQGTKLWELRAATSLAKLWREQGKRSEAHALLAPVYGWFTEGFETPDLKDAKALLDELRG